MRLDASARRWVARASVAVLSVTLLGAATQFSAAALAASRIAPATANPYSPAYQHSYRHGVVPTRGEQAKMSAWQLSHPGVPAAPSSDLTYGGGVDGIGVTTGAQKVYLVFYGSQWGTQGTDSNGNVTGERRFLGLFEGRFHDGRHRIWRASEPLDHR